MLPVQIAYICLEQSQLMGTLSDSWSKLTAVDHWPDPVHSLMDVADILANLYISIHGPQVYYKIY